ncbi:conserved Plasmodium protein, unknown function [Plasmodium berghei]|uniref:Uncharacterized protein n=1 Tax=Plasmodium berghei TaxID=5821 RepID=A0A1D3S9J4_PLABE|nr:conserved Plasmodium protein, unknown function [Plasmodium berghei]
MTKSKKVDIITNDNEVIRNSEMDDMGYDAISVTNVDPATSPNFLILKKKKKNQKKKKKHSFVNLREWTKKIQEKYEKKINKNNKINAENQSTNINNDNSLSSSSSNSRCSLNQNFYYPSDESNFDSDIEQRIRRLLKLETSIIPTKIKKEKFDELVKDQIINKSNNQQELIVNKTDTKENNYNELDTNIEISKNSNNTDDSNIYNQDGSMELDYDNLNITLNNDIKPYNENVNTSNEVPNIKHDQTFPKENIQLNKLNNIEENCFSINEKETKISFPDSNNSEKTIISHEIHQTDKSEKEKNNENYDGKKNNNQINKRESEKLIGNSNKINDNIIASSESNTNKNGKHQFENYKRNINTSPSNIPTKNEKERGGKERGGKERGDKERGGKERGGKERGGKERGGKERGEKRSPEQSKDRTRNNINKDISETVNHRDGEKNKNNSIESNAIKKGNNNVKKNSQNNDDKVKEKEEPMSLRQRILSFIPGKHYLTKDKNRDNKKNEHGKDDNNTNSINIDHNSDKYKGMNSHQTSAKKHNQYIPNSHNPDKKRERTKDKDEKQDIHIDGHKETDSERTKKRPRNREIGRDRNREIDRDRNRETGRDRNREVENESNIARKRSHGNENDNNHNKNSNSVVRKVHDYNSSERPEKERHIYNSSDNQSRKYHPHTNKTDDNENWETKMSKLKEKLIKKNMNK